MISNSLTELAARINEAYEAVASAQKGTLEYAVKTGELLQEAKNKLKHGKWSKWLVINCPNIPARTATDYMKLAEHQSPKFRDNWPGRGYLDSGGAVCSRAV